MIRFRILAILIGTVLAFIRTHLYGVSMPTLAHVLEATKLFMLPITVAYCCFEAKNSKQQSDRTMRRAGLDPTCEICLDIFRLLQVRATILARKDHMRRAMETRAKVARIDWMRMANSGTYLRRSINEHWRLGEHEVADVPAALYSMNLLFRH
ncbi:hypothetical protein EJ06DRAFT_532309 [Trichodelitschia bisporula]|uniref:Uncharacterized protein n=1 Tax=Trichodelitschia bisporula TaxID=703511 RepID=A0A6G1HPG4_9PEZI|nr:hypothetical protein EJ06DRAFT_532309 [Trichodelitschia bisporula]